MEVFKRKLKKIYIFFKNACRNKNLQLPLLVLKQNDMKTYILTYYENGRLTIKKKKIIAENEDKAFDIYWNMYETSKIEGETISLISLEEKSEAN